MKTLKNRKWYKPHGMAAAGKILRVWMRPMSFFHIVDGFHVYLDTIDCFAETRDEFVFSKDVAKKLAGIDPLRLTMFVCDRQVCNSLLQRLNEITLGENTWNGNL